YNSLFYATFTHRNLHSFPTRRSSDLKKLPSAPLVTQTSFSRYLVFNCSAEDSSLTCGMPSNCMTRGTSSWFSLITSQHRRDSESTSSEKKFCRRLTSNTRTAPGRRFLMKVRMVSRESWHRCASDPKQRASACAARACHCGV